MKTKFLKPLILTCLLSSLTVFAAGSQPGGLNPRDFKSPPAVSGVHTWWHWIHGNVTREGITKDLESMKSNGVVQATIFNVGGGAYDRIVPAVSFNSPEWIEMFRFALSEADRLGITIGIHNSDGWTTSGGPWITPELSMKTYVWTKTYVSGGQTVDIELKKPQSTLDYYVDYAVVAYPAKEAKNSFGAGRPAVTLNGTDTGDILYDGNPKSRITVRKGDKIEIAFPEPRTVDRLSLLAYMTFTWGNMDAIDTGVSLSCSDDGARYTKISDLKLTGMNRTVSASFEETTARYFMIESSGTLSELELLHKDEKEAFSPGVPNLLQQTIHVRGVRGGDYDAFDSRAAAIPEEAVLDLTHCFSADGTLNWDAPEGDWCIVRFGYTTTGKTNFPATGEGHGLECDKLDSAGITLQFDSFSKKLAEASGDYLGGTFKFVLIDSWECEYTNWTQKFPDEFRARRGYDIRGWIPVLCGEIVGDARRTGGFIHDFKKTIADLLDENYYRKCRDLCHENGLEMHAEVIYGDGGMFPPLDILKSNAYADMPMFEFWARPDGDQIPKFKSAESPLAAYPLESALVNGQSTIGAEAYTGYANFSETPALLKPFGDVAYSSGINSMILHSYVHQPLDRTPHVTLLNIFAGHFNRNNPWWEFARDWMDYQARVQYVLQRGEPAKDILYYAGDRFPQDFPLGFWRGLPAGYRANACNLEILDRARIVNGELTLGGLQSFPLLVLPERTSMEYATLQRVAELIEQGLTVYGPKPTGMLSLSDMKTREADFHKLADAVWGSGHPGESAYGKGKVISEESLAGVLENLTHTPDFATNMAGDTFLHIHKVMEGVDTYFVFNQQDSTLSRELLFRVGDKIPEIWDPVSGVTVKPAIYACEGEQLRIPVTFRPRQSLIFVFREGHRDNSITCVRRGSEQIFPAGANLAGEIPKAVYDNGYVFSTDRSGTYTFVTAAGQTLERNLTAPRRVVVSNFRALLEFIPAYDAAIAPLALSSLRSLTDFDDPSVRYFAGKIKYTIDFDAPEGLDASGKSFLLNLGQMSAAAEVCLNGEFLRYVWLPDDDIPFSGLKAKGNRLQVTVATSARNRFLGDLIEYGEFRTIETTSKDILKADMPLMPSGLIGPLTISEP